MKAEEEQRKLTSGMDDEVGVMKEPRYFAPVSGMSGTSRDEMSGVVKNTGAQKGQLHCDSASAVRERCRDSKAYSGMRIVWGSREINV